ncbi:tyrosine-protein phosphatase [Cytobacillus gottheilii]|uniref:tyrosine-protein phosphatase n=1 Tax=Cytobacillus gottheilii TaxID=859144 RepID=UPI0009BBCFA0|nr:CpsB/CapC family capsule biosynthesis tyrosine phosphatase [Cytobacillus gottheilii]
MIDIHCHILADVDDGAKTMEDSIEMAKAAVKEGLKTIIATPHLNQSYQNYRVDITTKVRELNDVLAKEQIPLTILPGQEVRIYGELLEDLQEGKILPLNHTQYLFVELPSNHVPRYTERLLYDIQMEELTPIIVHPERNKQLLEQPDLLYQFVKNGALTQVTASSLNGHFGKNIQKFSTQLLDSNLTHFVASDAHNTINRNFQMADAFAKVQSEYGSDMVYLLTENAQLLLSGHNVYKEIPEKVRRKKLFGIF